MKSSAPELFARINLARYSTLSASTVLLYEYVLTFNAELTLIWRQRWCFGKVVFLFNRYWGLLGLISGLILLMDDYIMYDMITPDELCVGITWLELISVTLSITGVEVILQARICAIYERNKRVIILLASLFALEIIACTVLFYANVGGHPLLSAPETPWILQGEIKYFHGMAGCVRDQDATIERANFLAWIPPIVLESILCLMMVYQAWTRYKEDWHNPLVNILIRDSVFYFFAIVAVLLLNCLFYALGARVAQDMLISLSWSTALPCCLGSRLLLNMNERYFDEQSFHNTCEEGSMRFRTRSMQPTVFSTVLYDPYNV